MRHRNSGIFFALATAGAITGSHPATADVLYTATWTDASVQGTPITGSFTYDATTTLIVSDTTAILSIPCRGTCGFQSPPGPPYDIVSAFLEFNAVDSPLVGPLPPPLQPPYLPGFMTFQFQNPLSTPTTYNPIMEVYANIEDYNGDYPWTFYTFTGGLSISPVPSPRPSSGVPALIALAGAVLWLRRNWRRKALRG